MVGQGDLPGARSRATAHQGHGAGRMVRGTEGTSPPLGAQRQAADRTRTAATSRASSSESGGRMPGKRLASMVLPVPGGPAKSRLWAPAAATSRARRAWNWPRTSGKVGQRLGGRGRACRDDGERWGSGPAGGRPPPAGDRRAAPRAHRPGPPRRRWPAARSVADRHAARPGPAAARPPPGAGHRPAPAHRRSRYSRGNQGAAAPRRATDPGRWAGRSGPPPWADRRVPG